MSKYLSWLFKVFLGIVIDIGGIGFISYRRLFGIMPFSMFFLLPGLWFMLCAIRVIGEGVISKRLERAGFLIRDHGNYCVSAV